MSDFTLPRAVEDFVAGTNAHDADAVFAVFADGATVRDDGHTYVTGAEIRAWIQSHMVDPRVVLSPTSFDAGRLIASGDGDFPGGPLVFAFDFVTEGDLVTDLAIGPV